MTLAVLALAVGLRTAGVAGVVPEPTAARAAASADGEIALDVDGSARRAIVVNAPADGTRRPAVIVLHGGMGSAAQMRATSGFDQVARANGFMAVYAEGTDFGGGRHAWNTGYLLRRQVRDADDIAYLDALIDRLVADRGADPARICMTGGSNGGMMTYVYAARRPDRLAAAAPVVASMFTFDRVPEVPLPILIINGARDDEVPIAGGMSVNPLVRAAQAAPFKPVREVVDFWVKANKSRAEGRSVEEGTVTTTTYPAGAGGAVTEFVVDREGGHGWPGTRPRREGSSPIASFRGAERVWAFFVGKSRAQPAAAREIQVLEFPKLLDTARGRAGEPAARNVPIKVHVPATGGPCPVIVVSHGAGGDWDTHFAQAQDLASHGYAVFCVEHEGSNRARLVRGLRPLRNLGEMVHDADEVLARPRDVSFAIDRAAEWNQAHESLKGRLDLAKVGVMGHSFGAFTAMAACGMRPALDWLRPEIAPGKGLGPDLGDPRVRCGVALSPQGVGDPFFTEESFASLRVPLLGISGTKDVQQSGETPEGRRDAFARWPAGMHRFVWISDARHVDFTSAPGDGTSSLPSASRDDVQPITRIATRAFFDAHLKSDAQAARILSEEGLRPYLRGAVTRVDVLAK